MQRFKYFTKQSNIYEIVNKIILEEQGRNHNDTSNVFIENWERKREKHIRKAYNQWINDALTDPFTNLRFRQTLTFDVFFRNTNICDTLRSTLAGYNDTLPKYVYIELLARSYFNKVIIGNENFICEFGFRDGSKITDYNLPGETERVAIFTDNMLEICSRGPQLSKACPLSKKGKKKVTFADDFPSQEDAATLELSKKVSQVDLTSAASSSDERYTKQKTKTPRPLVPNTIEGSPFKPNSPIPCSSVIRDKVKNWKTSMELSSSPVSGSQLVEDLLPMDADASIDTAETERNLQYIDTEERDEIMGITEEDVIPMNVDLTQDSVVQSQQTPELQIPPFMVQIHTPGQMMLNSYSVRRSSPTVEQNPRDPVFAVQGCSNELNINRTLSGLSVEVSQTAPEGLFDGTGKIFKMFS